MSGRSPLPTKPCAVCGRTITWRKKWERDWESVRYCSQACRRGGLDDTDRALERTMREQLERASAGSTVCPSQAAREVAPQDWRPLMEASRAAARRLVNAGVAEITQGGVVVDPSTARGPIRVRPVRR